MEKKYRLLEDDTITIGSRVLHRIEALRDFVYVKKGDKGGYIESEDNLSQKGNCWIYDDARVYGSAQVYDNAMVSDNARVHGDAMVSDNAWVRDNAEVSADARVFVHARISDNAWVHGDAEVCGYAVVGGDAKVCGDVMVSGDAVVSGTARIYATSDYYVGKNVWSSGRYFTYTHSNKMWRVGCFYGTGEELIEKAYQDSEVSGREYARTVRYVEAMYADLEQDKELIKTV